jgi:RNA polymerase sigma-70 factor, ECF subfamily
VTTLHYSFSADEAPRAMSDSASAAQRALDGFLRGVERRALKMAEYGGAVHDDALDIVQDAMIGFVQRYADKPTADWAPLFYRCLSSRITDWQRRATVRGRWFKRLLPSLFDDDSSDPLEALPDAGPIDPALLLSGQEFSASLEAALKKLPQRQREVFLLRVWEGLDVEQTAAALGIGEGSIKTHLFRALKNLRAALETHAKGLAR